MNSLRSLFQPRSIAVIGASANPAKLGHTVLQNILAGRYSGRLCAVNPKSEKILGVPTYQRIADVPGEIELAVVVVPAPIATRVVEECGQAGVRSVIVIAAGFREVGKAGATREAQLRHAAKHHNMRLLGPNCLGLIDTVHHLNVSFASNMPPQAPIAVLSQSGAMCTAILDWAKGVGLGFSMFVSLGNKADLTEAEFLEAWTDDPHVKVVLGYLEGVADGPRFVRAVPVLTRQKPFVLAKAGTSAAGTAAVGSHTGSLVGADDVLDVVLHRAGVTRARTIEELFDYTLAFADTPLPVGNRVAIITNAGGPAVMTTDAVTEAKLSLATLSDDTQRTLGKALPPEATTHNPIDCVGDARASRYQVALTTVLKDRQVDAAIVLLTPQAMTEITATAEVIIQAAKASGKPVVASFIGGQAVEAGLEKLQQARLAAFAYPERAVKALAALARYAAFRARPARRDPKVRKPPRTAVSLMKKHETTGQRLLAGIAACQLVKPYGLTSPKFLDAHTVDEAVTAASKVKYPVVLKVDAQDVLHKTDLGGVVLDLTSGKEVSEAYGVILKSVQKRQPDVRIRGVTVNHMVEEGLDFIVGAKRDETFGPVVMVGLGGVHVEVLHDVSLGLAPLTEQEADELIDRTKGATLLPGVRGEPAADRRALKQAVLAVSRLMIDFPQISAVDLNPLRVFVKGAMSLDTKIILADAA